MLPLSSTVLAGGLAAAVVVGVAAGSLSRAFDTAEPVVVEVEAGTPAEQEQVSRAGAEAAPAVPAGDPPRTSVTVLSEPSEPAPSASATTSAPATPSAAPAAEPEPTREPARATTPPTASPSSSPSPTASASPTASDPAEVEQSTKGAGKK